MLRSTGQTGNGSLGGVRLSVRTVTATTTAAPNDYTIRCNAASGAITVNLPAASTCTGQRFNVKKIDASANIVTVDPAGSETIDGSLTMGLSSQWQSLEFQSNGASWDVLSIS